MSNEQKLTINEQKLTSNAQRAKSSASGKETVKNYKAVKKFSKVIPICNNSNKASTCNA